LPPSTVQDEGITINQNICNHLSGALSNPRSPESLTQTTLTDRVQPELYTHFTVIPVWYVPNQGTFSSRYSINWSHSQIFSNHSDHSILDESLYKDHFPDLPKLH